jgi:hypothetical protein
MEVHERLHELCQELGYDVLDDADNFRGALDDFLDESAVSTGDINVLVDAVRLGAYERMVRMLELRAVPAAAVEAAGDLLSRERGSADVAGSRWACAVLGYAIDKVEASEVQRYRTSAGGGPQLSAVPAAPVESAPTAQPPAPAEAAAPYAAPSWHSPASPPGPYQQWQPPVVGAQDGSTRKRSRRLLLPAMVALIAVTIGGAWYALAKSDGGTDSAGGSAPTGQTTGRTTPPSSGGTVPPPAPFVSAALYDMASPYFDPADCFTPAEPSDAPVAMETPDKELVKCEPASGEYSATLWCKDTAAQLLVDRHRFQDTSGGPLRRLDALPAGQSRWHGYRITFHHKNGDPRVYWESARDLCAAELRGGDNTLAETEQFWRAGR